MRKDFAKNVSIYLCGPTTYDYPHVGNIRPPLTIDFLVSALKHLGHNVQLVHNVTDIDDKIIVRAQSTGKSFTQIAQHFASNYFNLLDKLRVDPPFLIPYVTKHVPLVVAFVKKLFTKNVVYTANGSVYFDVRMVPTYGQLANRKLKEGQFKSGAKRFSADFAVWKKTNGLPQWDSPWSPGRPGWHTECAAFVHHFFKGKTIDVHAGGIDLKFPHHENEDAQFQALNGRPITKHWIHVGHVHHTKGKMAKRTGSFVRADHFLAAHGPDVTRALFLLSNPFAPMQITSQTIVDAKKLVNRLTKVFCEKYTSKPVPQFTRLLVKLRFMQAVAHVYELLKAFRKNPTLPLQDDLNTIIRILKIGLKTTTT